jgi:hypothetical protein
MKNIFDLNSSINHLDMIDICRIFHKTMAESSSFSNSHRTCFQDQPIFSTQKSLDQNVEWKKLRDLSRNNLGKNKIIDKKGEEVNIKMIKKDCFNLIELLLCIIGSVPRSLHALCHLILNTVIWSFIRKPRQKTSKFLFQQTSQAR